MAVFPSLKQNFIAYRSSSRPDWSFEIPSCDNQALVGYIPIAAVVVHLNIIIKIGQSSYKMYSNNILNFQESTTILNACTKKRVGNLLNAPRTWNFILLYF